MSGLISQAVCFDFHAPALAMPYLPAPQLNNISSSLNARPAGKPSMIPNKAYQVTLQPLSEVHNSIGERPTSLKLFLMPAKIY